MIITESDLVAARIDWGNGLVAIAKAYDSEGIDSARPMAEKLLDTVYGFDLGPVLFKPTLSGGAETFRPTRTGALSYYVGHDPAHPLDNGFGLRGWREFSSETAAHFIDGDVRRVRNDQVKARMA